jgi:hypothetical protein
MLIKITLTTIRHLQQSIRLIRWDHPVQEQVLGSTDQVLELSEFSGRFKEITQSNETEIGNI